MNIKVFKLRLTQFIEFIKNDIWRVSLKEFSPIFAFFIRIIRIILFAVRSFIEEKIPIRASALTFYSLLSIVPVIAMIFGIAKGFGLETLLEKELRDSFSNQSEVLEQSIKFAHSMLETTKGGLVAGVSLLFLFWTIIQLLSNIEDSFNGIWRVENARSYLRKLTDYLSMMFIVPVLLILSSSATVFLTTQIKNITQEFEILGYVSPMIFFGLKLIPYILIWLLLTVIYVVMPNTKVNFFPALIAGIIAGTAYQATQWAYIAFQIGVARNNAIYGSFAALPLLLIWLQLSWFIILIGAVISASIQNASKQGFDKSASNLSISAKRLLALSILRVVIENFSKSSSALSVQEIADKLEIPEHFVDFSLKELKESEIISEVLYGKEKLKTYQPAQDINNMTFAFVIDNLDKKGIDKIEIPKTDEIKKIKEILENLKNSNNNSKENILLKNI